ncbi:hypothetical protein AAEO56_12875 [Flavobacterium sp. DGU11]|uniref:Uncharacterized protein n=1 Tax=Flavobacterium arundinis TaxID=3139143 RepID=A0ABU9HYC0_9FLAO
MPSTLHYKGELYFSSYSELEAVLHLIGNEIPARETYLKIDRPALKLAIETSEPFSKKEALEKLWHTAATFATAGMILTFHDQDFEEVTCADRKNDFDPTRPGIIMFSLNEFEESFGKLEMEVSDVVYNSPFYIYDQTLKKAGPKFADEIPISDNDCTTGFDILKIIWGTHVAKSSTFLFPFIFKKLYDYERNTYSVASTYGFAPGYDMDTAMEEARKNNFIVIRWDEFWRK